MAKILIVDDEEMERVLVAAMLEGEGHHLSFARDVESGLGLCRSIDPDLVITDLAMPGASGLRLIKELREEQFDVPIIAMSKWAADQLDLAQAYGADFVLYKPVDRDGFRAKVREALGLRSQRPRDPWFREEGG
jgi:CheY-like chemotaxis protein